MARLFGRRSPAVPSAPPAVPARVERVIELPPPPRPLKPGSAVAAVMGAGEAESFADKPYGGNSHGEMLASPEPEPPAPPSRGLEIEDPPWKTDLENGTFDPALLAPLESPPEKMDPVAQLKIETADYEEPRPWAPPMQHQPLEAVRPAIPEANWAAEQRQRTPAAPAPAPPGERPIFDPPPWVSGEQS